MTDSDELSARLDAIEAQIAVLSDRLGVAWRPGGAPPGPQEGYVFEASSTVPPEVAEMYRSGNRIGAIKRYRELTGAGLQDARDVLASL